MPRVRNPLILKHICINVIARNFERMWGQHFDSQLGDVPRLLHVIGPFDDLPGQLCQDIFHTVEKMRVLRKSHLHLLLVPQTTHVHFSVTYANSLVVQALEILMIRCKKLVSLDLTNSMSLSPKIIAEGISAFPLLRTLILKQTKINDNIMKNIATYLPCLNHLNLHGCPVTNRGALWLCGDNGDFEPVCKDLILLDISATKIELTGCSAIVQCFPKLRYLTFPDSLEAVAQLHQGEASVMNGINGETRVGISSEASTSSNRTVTKASTSGPASHHKLEILHATALRCRKIDPDSVRLACHYCPYIREIYWYQDANDEAMKHLLCLQHLSVLEVTSDKPNAVTFHGGVKPLLLSRGKELLAIGLYDVQGTDLGLLGYLCPQLQRLKVVSMHEEADFAQSYLTAKQQADSFKVLRQLTLVFGTDSIRFDPSHLLFHTQALQELHLIEVPCLTDQVLETALAAHGFCCLKQVQLESCDQISSSCVTQLVTTCSHLTHLSLKGCQLISYQEFQELSNLIKKEGLDISVEWD